MRIENLLAGRVEMDAIETMYPSRVRGGRLDVGHAETFGSAISTVYLYVLAGRVVAQSPMPGHALPELFELESGSYLAQHGPLFIRAKTPAAYFLVERFGYRGQFTIGRREERGRLSYIDGCSDSILVYPARQGDPVLNHLHFPDGIVQTQHLHPSIRIGCVVVGEGAAWGPGWNKPLKVGDVFLLGEQEMHSFRTDGDGTHGMDVIAFHPDSDWGPVDANHPMLNRTYINHGQR